MTSPVSPPAAAGPRAWWRERSIGAKAAIVVIGAVVAVNLVLAALNLVVGGSPPGGPTSSSYSTGTTGYAAWADLLVMHGHNVTKVRGALSSAHISSGSTLVVADPDTLDSSDSKAVSNALAAGDTVVVLGGGTTSVDSLAGGDVTWSPVGAASARVLAPTAETFGLHRIRRAGGGGFDHPGFLLPILGSSPDDVLAAVGSVPARNGGGPGRLVAVADAGIFQNAYLSADDNAAFALQIVGSGRPVYFAEGVHGFGQSAGLSVIPANWRWAFLGAVIAVLVGMWSVARRFGPPEAEARELAAVRGRFVDALAASLARTGRPDEATEPVRDAVRRSLRQRTGASASLDDARLIDRAVAVGVDANEARWALHVPHTDAELLAVAQAAARVRSGSRPRSPALDATGGSTP